jgi:K+-transporting ATPase KdpF subunit
VPSRLTARLDAGQYPDNTPRALSMRSLVDPTRFLRANSMTTILLWLLIIAVGVYLLIAMLRPDKF